MLWLVENCEHGRYCAVHVCSVSSSISFLFQGNRLRPVSSCVWLNTLNKRVLFVSRLLPSILIATVTVMGFLNLREEV